MQRTISFSVHVDQQDAASKLDALASKFQSLQTVIQNSTKSSADSLTSNTDKMKRKAEELEAVLKKTQDASIKMSSGKGLSDKEREEQVAIIKQLPQLRREVASTYTNLRQSVSDYNADVKKSSSAFISNIADMKSALSNYLSANNAVQKYSDQMMAKRIKNSELAVKEQVKLEELAAKEAIRINKAAAKTIIDEEKSKKKPAIEAEKYSEKIDTRALKKDTQDSLDIISAKEKEFAKAAKRKIADIKDEIARELAKIKTEIKIKLTLDAKDFQRDIERIREKTLRKNLESRQLYERTALDERLKREELAALKQVTESKREYEERMLKLKQDMELDNIRRTEASHALIFTRQKSEANRQHQQNLDNIKIETEAKNRGITAVRRLEDIRDTLEDDFDAEKKVLKGRLETDIELRKRKTAERIKVIEEKLAEEIKKINDKLKDSLIKIEEDKVQKIAIIRQKAAESLQVVSNTHEINTKERRQKVIQTEKEINDTIKKAQEEAARISEEHQKRVTAITRKGAEDRANMAASIQESGTNARSNVFANQVGGGYYRQLINGQMLDATITKIRGHLVWLMAGVFVGGTLSGLQQVIDKFKELQDVTIKIKQNLELSEKYGAFNQKTGAYVSDAKAGAATSILTEEYAPKLAMKYGYSLKETLEVMQILSRRFKDANEIIEYTDQVLTIAKLDFVDTATAAKNLEAVILQFGLNALQSKDFVNQFSIAVHSMRITGDELLGGLQRSGSVFKDFKMGTKEAIAAISAMTTVTARSGETVGNAFKTILSRIQSDRASMKLEQFGINVYDDKGNLGDPTKIFNEIKKGFDKLSEAKKIDLAVTLSGGVMQVNQLKAFLNEGINEYTAAIQKMDNLAKDSVTQQLLKEGLNSFSTSIGRAKLSIELLVNTMSDRFLPSLIECANTVTSFFQELTKIYKGEEAFWLLEVAVKALKYALEGLTFYVVIHGIVSFIKQVQALIAFLGVMSTATSIAEAREIALAVAKGTATAITNANSVATAEDTTATILNTAAKTMNLNIEVALAAIRNTNFARLMTLTAEVTALEASRATNTQKLAAVIGTTTAAEAERVAINNTLTTVEARLTAIEAERTAIITALTAEERALAIAKGLVTEATVAQTIATGASTAATAANAEATAASTAANTAATANIARVTSVSNMASGAVGGLASAFAFLTNPVTLAITAVGLATWALVEFTTAEDRAVWSASILQKELQELNGDIKGIGQEAYAAAINLRDFAEAQREAQRAKEQVLARIREDQKTEMDNRIIMDSLLSEGKRYRERVLTANPSTLSDAEYSHRIEFTKQDKEEKERKKKELEDARGSGEGSGAGGGGGGGGNARSDSYYKTAYDKVKKDFFSGLNEQLIAAKGDTSAINIKDTIKKFKESVSGLTKTEDIEQDIRKVLATLYRKDFKQDNKKDPKESKGPRGPKEETVYHAARQDYEDKISEEEYSAEEKLKIYRQYTDDLVANESLGDRELHEHKKLLGRLIIAAKREEIELLDLAAEKAKDGLIGKDQDYYDNKVRIHREIVAQTEKDFSHNRVAQLKAELDLQKAIVDASKHAQKIKHLDLEIELTQNKKSSLDYYKAKKVMAEAELDDANKKYKQDTEEHKQAELAKAKAEQDYAKAVIDSQTKIIEYGFKLNEIRLQSAQSTASFLQSIQYQSDVWALRQQNNINEQKRKADIDRLTEIAEQYRKQYGENSEDYKRYLQEIRVLEAKSAAERLKEEQDLFKAKSKYWLDAGNVLEKGISDALANIITGFEDWDNLFKNLWRNLVNSIVRMFTDELAKGIMRSISSIFIKKSMDELTNKEGVGELNKIGVAGATEGAKQAAITAATTAGITARAVLHKAENSGFIAGAQASGLAVITIMGTMATATIATINALAAAVAAIPVIGTAQSLAMTTAATAATGAVGTALTTATGALMAMTAPTATLDTGTLNVPKDMIAQIHKGEMVVPEPFARGIRNGTNNVLNGNNSSFSPTININANAIDGRGMKKALSGASKDMVNILSTEHRRFNRGKRIS